MNITHTHNPNQLACTPGARRHVGYPGVLGGGLSPDLSTTFGFASYFLADDPTGGTFNRDTALRRGSKSSSLVNERRPGSTAWQARLTSGRRMPVTG